MGKRKVGGNSKEEVDEIIKQNYPKLKRLIELITKRYANCQSDRDDLYQAGWEACIMKARHYDKEKHLEFIKHVSIEVWHVVSQLAKRNSRHAGDRVSDFVSKSDEQVRLIRDVVSTKLNATLLEIVDLKFYKNATLEEVAKATKLSVMQVRAKLAEALQVLKREFEEVGITGFDYNKNTSHSLLSEGEG